MSDSTAQSGVWSPFKLVLTAAMGLLVYLGIDAAREEEQFWLAWSITFTLVGAATLTGEIVRGVIREEKQKR